MVGKDKEATEAITVQNNTDKVIKIRERDRIGGSVPNRWVQLNPGAVKKVTARPDYAKKKGLTVVGEKAEKVDLPEAPEEEVKPVLGRVSGKVVETKKKA